MDDWIYRNKDTDKYIGLTVRGALSGEPWELVSGIEKEKLVLEDGWKEILDILDKKYGVDKRWRKIEYMNHFYKIERKKGENIRDFISRFELALRNCLKNGMKEMEEEQLGGLFLGRANLEENEEKIVLGVLDGCLDYKKVTSTMLGILKGDKRDERKVWLNEEENKREIRCYKCQKLGHISRNCTEEKSIRECQGCGKKGHVQEECRYKDKKCFECGEKGHMKYDCKKNREQTKNVVLYGERGEEEVKWEIVKGIIDTGCNNSIVGDM